MRFGKDGRTIIVLASAAAAMTVSVNPAHAVGTDTTPPSVPSTVRQVGADRPWSESSIAWSASTDDSGSVSYYWVNNVTYGNRVRPRATAVALGNLFLPLCDVPRGTVIRVTVEAVDAAGNRSAPSPAIEVRVN
jgi:hypothetical protein